MEKAISQEAKSAIIDALNGIEFHGDEGFDDAISFACEIVESFPTSDSCACATWIPVTERLPEKNGFYIVYFQDGNISTAKYDSRYIESNKWMWAKAYGYIPPSHWQPLPTQPVTK